MNRDEMMQRCAEHGLDTEAIKDAPDQTLAEIIRSHEAKDAANAQQQKSDMADGDGDNDADDYSEFDDMDPNEYAEPEGDEDKAKFHDKIRRYADYHAAGAARAASYMERFLATKNAEPAPPEPPPAEPVSAVNPGGAQHARPKKVVTTQHFSEQDFEDRVAAAVEKALQNGVNKSIEQLNKFTEEQIASQKRSTVDAFCEENLKLGKILASELDESDPKRPSLRSRLLRADAKNIVHKYRENGKEVALTELELQMAEIKARPAFKFGERFKAPASTTPEDGDIAEIEAHFEQFADVFKPLGETKESLVEGFKAEKKARPQLTAKAFLQK